MLFLLDKSLFISILRSPPCHQSEQFSERVGQESPGVGLAGREGGISVDPPYSLLCQQDGDQAADLILSVISHYWTVFVNTL